MNEHMIEFQLVDNKSYDVSGVYYGGQHHKYHDLLVQKTHKKVAENLNHGGYAFEVVHT